MEPELLGFTVVGGEGFAAVVEDEQAVLARVGLVLPVFSLEDAERLLLHDDELMAQAHGPWEQPEGPRPAGEEASAAGDAVGQRVPSTRSTSLGRRRPGRRG